MSPKAHWPRLSLALALGVLAALACLPNGAVAAEQPAKYMQRVGKQLVVASRSRSESAFADAVRSHSDYTSIGLYSLGSYSRRLDRADRPSYFTGMINFIARYAAKEAPKYPVANFVVTGQTEETRTGAYVDSRVTLRDGTTYDVRWLLVRRGSSYKVRDAQVLGFWMSPFLKNLFEDYITNNGGNPRALVVALSR
ncbi:MAG: ABC transporter substrate-binding protein [Hyphomicrobiaceae bacterium]